MGDFAEDDETALRDTIDLFEGLAPPLAHRYKQDEDCYAEVLLKGYLQDHRAVKQFTPIMQLVADYWVSGLTGTSDEKDQFFLTIRLTFMQSFFFFIAASG